MKNLVIIITFIAWVNPIFSQVLNEVNIPSEYPTKQTVLKDIKNSSDVINGLNGLSLGINKGEVYTITEYVPDKENIPANCPANIVLYKISLDYPKMNDNTHKRVFIAAFYNRTIGSDCKAGNWSFAGIHKHLSWFDEAHIIDPTGTDLTHQKNVEKQKQKDLEEKKIREEKKKGTNAANDDEMKNIALEGIKSKPNKFFGTMPISEITEISVTIPDDNNYTGKGTICSFVCMVNYKHNGQSFSKKMKIQGKRASENEPFKFLAAFEQ